MSELLKTKVVVVTGAGSGIGRAIASASARHGAKASTALYVDGGLLSVI